MNNKRSYGIIRMYDPLKGFGFLRNSTGKGKDIFFFYQDLDIDDKDICIGDVLSFNIEQAPRGPRAREIKKES